MASIKDCALSLLAAHDLRRGNLISDEIMIGLLAGCGVTSPGSILHPAKARQRDPIRGPLRRLQTSRAALSQTRAGLGFRPVIDRLQFLSCSPLIHSDAAYGCSP